VSTPLRRSLPDRRPALDRLSSLVMAILRQTRTIYAVAGRAVNNPISTTGGVLAGKKSASNFVRNRASGCETAGPVRQNLAWSNFDNDLALCSIGLLLKSLADIVTRLQYGGFS
jgi:hypothetical protein